MYPINEYERKKQARINRYLDKAEQARAESSSLSQKASDWETAPFASYQLSNLNQEIHRLEKRISQLTQAKEEGFQGWEFDGGKVVANSEKNRLQIFFDSIPPEEVRSDLKCHGFHWARSEGAWQRQLSQNAIYSCRHIKAIQPLDGSNPVKIQPRKKNSPQR